MTRIASAPTAALTRATISLKESAAPSANEYDVTLSIGDAANLSIAEALLTSPQSRLFLDNGEFDHFVSGDGPVDAEAYWQWANPILDRNPQALAVIPDGICNPEADNLALIVDGLLQRSDSTHRAVPVWHLSESTEQLQSILDMGFETIAIGTPSAALSREALGSKMMVAADTIMAHGRAGEGPAIHIMAGLAQFLIASKSICPKMPCEPVPARPIRDLATA